jgi:hypothetical protein
MRAVLVRPHQPLPVPPVRPAPPPERLGRPVAVLAGLYLLAAVLMTVLLAVGSPDAGTTSEKLAALSAGAGMYSWGFVAASLVGPLFVALIVAGILWGRRAELGARDAIAVVFLAAYLPLASLAYVSQYTLLPALLEQGSPQAPVWFFGEAASVPYAADLLGYALFGVAAVLLAVPLLSKTGAWKVVGWSLGLSGATSIVGLAGYALGSGLLELGVLVGAVLTVPFAAALAYLAVRGARADGGR